MANALYNLGKEGFLGGDIAWDSDSIKAILVDSNDYTPNIVTDQFLSDIPPAAIVATSSNFSSKTISGGVADADDIVYTAVSGDESELLVIYQDTGVTTTSRLIALIDTATGLPVTPNGGDITVQWDNGSNKIFAL